VGREVVLYRLLPVLAVFVSSSTQAQSLNEGFEGGSIPSSWTVINNNADAETWETQQGDAHSGNWAACLLADNNSTPKTDDWLITPQVMVEANDTFSFWIKGTGLSACRMGFKVHVSTTTPQVSSFIETLDIQETIPETYTHHSYPLSSYSSQEIYVAIQSTHPTGITCIPPPGLLIDDVGGPDTCWHYDDMAVLSIDEPLDESQLQADTVQSIEVVVRNRGLNTQWNVPVILELTDSSGPVYGDTAYTDTLDHGSTQNITFEWQTPESVEPDCSGERFTITTWTSLGADDYLPNDTAVVTVKVFPRGALLEDFEDGDISHIWTVIDNNNNGYEWIPAESRDHAYSGRWFGVLHYATSGNNDWLISPWLIVESGDLFCFWAKSRIAPWLEDFNVLVSRTTLRMDKFTDTLDKVTGVPTTYTQYFYSLDTYAGDSIFIALHSTSTDGYFLDIDDLVGPKWLLAPGAEERMKAPSSFDLVENSPNPMRTKTIISYRLAKGARVSLKIYDCTGSLIKTLVDKKSKPGSYSVTWNRLDENGKVQPSGVYFYKMESATFCETRKLILLH
jgi:hypothetical protein